VYVKGANLEFCLKEGPFHVVNLLVLFFPIFLSILSLVPKAQGQNLVRLSSRNEHDLIYKASLFFQDRHALSLMVFATSCDFPALLVISTTRVNIFLLLSVVEGERNPSRARRRKGLFALKAPRYCCDFVGVNCQNMMQLAIETILTLTSAELMTPLKNDGRKPHGTFVPIPPQLLPIPNRFFE
jgi:hypothetical protein